MFKLYQLIWLLLLSLVACGPATANLQPTSPPVTSEIPVATERPTIGPIATRSNQASEESPTPISQTPIEDEEVALLFQALLGDDSKAANDALQRIRRAEDSRFISVLLELQRAGQIGLIGQLDYNEIVDALQELSGQSLGDDWPAWVEWYGATDLQPVPGFTGWKGDLLSGIDPLFGQFLQDDFPSRIRPEEIAWGGVVVDGIPALDNPTMIPAADADYLDPWDAVFGITINDDSRAYPLRILDWHEMANDIVGGVPVSLAYCTLCGAAIAYDGRSMDGTGNPITYDFGSSGFLYRSNKLMYDRQTRTLWNQLTGEPILGELAAYDISLDLLPVVLTNWDSWREQHPDTTVVDIDTGFNRPYDPGAAYGGYFAYEETMFPVWQRNDALTTKDQIFALNINDTPKAYPLSILTEQAVVNDEVGGIRVVLVTGSNIVEVNGEDWRTGPVKYDAGAEIRAFDRGDYSFHPGPEPGIVLDESGAEWFVTEDALVGPGGKIAARRPGHLAYWFGWYAFYPETEVFGS